MEQIYEILKWIECRFLEGDIDGYSNSLLQKMAIRAEDYVGMLGMLDVFMIE